MFVRGTTRRAFSVMKDKIRYKFEETPGAARVLIATADLGALAAVQQFLRLQIEEHNPETRRPSKERRHSHFQPLSTHIT